MRNSRLLPYDTIVQATSGEPEAVNVFLVTDDDIIICDPEAEYAPLVRRLHGQIIRISPVGSVRCV